MRPGREHILRLHPRSRAARRDVSLIGPSLGDAASAAIRPTSASAASRQACRAEAEAGVAAVAGWRGNAPAGRTVDVDAEASLPALIEEVRRQMTPDRQRVVQERSAKHAAANQPARTDALRRALEQRRAGWDASPISTARIYAELWPLIVDEDWILASPEQLLGRAQHAAVGSQQAVQLSGRTGRGGHGLRCAGGGRRRRWRPRRREPDRRQRAA